MPRSLTASVVVAGLLVVVGGQTRSFTIDYSEDTFVKDGESFRYISGSIHYTRVPRVHWKDRLMKIYAAGLNTIQTYVPWNLHQRQPFQSDFSGNLDFVSFVKLAQDVGLLVILRPGPYTDAGWDFGGLPAWLMESQYVNRNIVLRSNNTDYIAAVVRWFDDLLPRVRPLLYNNGGPIISVQVENEYGSYFACDHDYLRTLRDIMRSHLGDDIVLFTTDGPGASFLRCGTLEGLYATIDFGLTDSPEKMFAAQRQFQPHGPLVCSEFYVESPLDYWGYNHSRQSPQQAAESLDLLLAYGANINMYMFEGGTNFGYSSGSLSGKGSKVKVATTTYDHGAPMSEAGDLGEKYHAIRKVVYKYVKRPVEPVPPDTVKFAYGQVRLKLVGDILDVLPSVTLRPVKSVYPLCMEDIHQYYGFTLYRHVSEKSYVSQELWVDGVRDRGYVIINKVMQGILVRGETTHLNIILHKGDNLDILVENQGRIFYGNDINKNQKGIVGNVTLGEVVLQHWTMFPLSLANSSAHIRSSKPRLQAGSDTNRTPLTPSLYMGTFTLPSTLSQPLDTYVDMRPWHKGQLFINGNNVGGYWPTLGPQVTLYVPLSFLKPHPASNTVLALELESAPCPHACSIHFVDQPFINKTVNTFN
ncbi:beta-galactosidase-like [Haliotis rufescens]|uniref:beta-galactosidase-like n=1 Tax=Haliotis rufescens TaxID=6454 RepID=UPI00201FAE90|nr:beta-galactosidase-like [Haliotis rufescens]